MKAKVLAALKAITGAAIPVLFSAAQQTGFPTWQAWTAALLTGVAVWLVPNKAVPNAPNS